MTLKKVKSETINKTPSSQLELKNMWIWLIIPLSIFAYNNGCSLDTGGNVLAGALMIFGPFFLGLWLAGLIILLLVGLKNKNKSHILISKIGLLIISYPVSYTAGVILCHL